MDGWLLSMGLQFFIGKFAHFIGVICIITIVQTLVGAGPIAWFSLGVKALFFLLAPILVVVTLIRTFCAIVIWINT